MLKKDAIQKNVTIPLHIIKILVVVVVVVCVNLYFLQCASCCLFLNITDSPPYVIHVYHTNGSSFLQFTLMDYTTFASFYKCGFGLLWNTAVMSIKNNILNCTFSGKMHISKHHLNNPWYIKNPKSYFRRESTILFQYCEIYIPRLNWLDYELLKCVLLWMLTLMIVQWAFNNNLLFVYRHGKCFYIYYIVLRNK